MSGKDIVDDSAYAGADADAYEELFRGLDRLGPGDDLTTKSVLDRVRPSLPPRPLIADMGCGVGASTLVLARALPDARITAIDNYPAFLDRLRHRASSAGVAQRVSGRIGTMDDPCASGIEPARFHLIWAESSIYAVGRPRALRAWRQLLRPGGFAVFSDVVWKTPPEARPPVTVAFWAGEYPAMTDSETVVRELAEHGFRSIDAIEAPRSAWSNYYDPLRPRIVSLKPAAGSGSGLARVLATMEREIAVFDSDDHSFASVYFVARAITRNC